MPTNEKKSVVVIGAWHLGAVIGTCLASEGHSVSLWDQNPNIQKLVSRGEPAIFEPGLQELMSSNWNKTLTWAGDQLPKVVSDWVIFSYDLQVTETDDVVLDVLYEGVDALVKSGLSVGTNILITSQVPVGTCSKIKKIISGQIKDWTGELIYSPENLRLGSAISSMKAQDMVALGLRENSNRKEFLSSEFRCLYSLKDDVTLNVMSIESAEMVKHTLNAFLANTIVFANEISDICEKVGANAHDVLSSLKHDSRVSPKAPLSPGLGFSGATLARDIKTLQKLSSEESLFGKIYQLNSSRNDWIVTRLAESLGGNLAGKKIVLLGLTYKAGTSTVRRSATLDLFFRLKKRDAVIAVVDPLADREELRQIKGTSDLKVEIAPEGAFSAANAVVLMTDWPQFLDWDWKSLLGKMKVDPEMGPVILDTKNFLARILPKNIKLILPGQASATRN